MSTTATATVLVVDDDASTRASLRALLEDAGYRVAIAPSGPCALEHAAAERADVALIDVRMPSMSGWEVYERLRDRGIGIPVVFMSVDHDVRSVARQRAAGYIGKPFEVEALLNVVGRVIAGRKGD
jgi:CheY-like chemotaxis protein